MNLMPGLAIELSLKSKSKVGALGGKTVPVLTETGAVRQFNWLSLDEG